MQVDQEPVAFEALQHVLELESAMKQMTERVKGCGMKLATGLVVERREMKRTTGHAVRQREMKRTMKLLRN